MALFCQYFYYQRVNPQPYGHPKRTGTSTSRRLSVTDRAPRYRTLSAVAANVAAAAALAAEHDELHGPRHGKLYGSQDRFTQGSGSRVSRDTTGEEEGQAALADSFISEGGLTIGRKQVSWSVERNSRRGGSVGRYSANPHNAFSSHHHVPTSGTETFSSRGRTLQREAPFNTDTLLSSTVRRASKASRQGSGMVFLSVFAMFSLGTVARFRSSDDNLAHVGKVLSVRPIASALEPIYKPDISLDLAARHAIRSEQSHVPPEKGVAHISIPTPDLPELTTSDSASERVLGRFFAWLCTTLYLTSRLPQIWKNVSD